MVKCDEIGRRPVFADEEASGLRKKTIHARSLNSSMLSITPGSTLYRTALNIDLDVSFLHLPSYNDTELEEKHAFVSH